MIESVSLPIPRLSRDAFESVPRTSTVMRFERSGLGLGFGVGAGVGLAVGDGLRVGVGDGLAVGISRAIGLGATTRVQATTTTMSTAASSVSVPVLQGRMALGTWQSIALVDANAEKTARQVRLSFVPA